MPIEPRVTNNYVLLEPDGSIRWLLYSPKPLAPGVWRRYLRAAQDRYDLLKRFLDHGRGPKMLAASDEEIKAYENGIPALLAFLYDAEGITLHPAAGGPYH